MRDIKGESKEKLQLPLPTKRVNHIPERIAEVSATVKDLKDEWMIIPSNSLFNLPM